MKNGVYMWSIHVEVLVRKITSKYMKVLIFVKHKMSYMYLEKIHIHYFTQRNAE